MDDVLQTARLVAGSAAAATDAGSVKLAGTVMSSVVLPLTAPTVGIIRGAPDVSSTVPALSGGELVAWSSAAAVLLDDDVDELN